MPSQADAEDVVQAAFVRFWKKHPAAEREHYPLLYAAVRTIALDTLRGNDRRIRRENAPEAPNKARKFRSLTSASSRARFLRSLRRT
jgi:DNA-directed RNA polymerase specialized sigma24 family protein